MKIEKLCPSYSWSPKVNQVCYQTVSVTQCVLFDNASLFFSSLRKAWGTLVNATVC